MADFVLMPKLGFNMERGLIVQWLKREGEPVQKGDGLLEIMTDKTNMVIESTLTGYLRKILVEAGEEVAVFLPIAIIGEEREDIAALIEEAWVLLGKDKAAEEKDGDGTGRSATKVSLREADSRKPAEPGRIKLTPRARRYIEENNLDITELNIQGTGFQGGITAADLQACLKEQRIRITPLAEKIAAGHKLPLAALAGTGPSGKITRADVEAAVQKGGDRPTSLTETAGEGEVLQAIKYVGMRKIIGERLSKSMYSAPHIYFTTSLVMDRLLTLRQEINEAQEQKVSVNDFLAAAVVKALQKFPQLNSSLRGDMIVQYQDVNLGIAVALEDGLIVPVIKKAQDKSITELARQSRHLIDKALKGSLLPDEYKGGTFTISNLGMYGIENFTAIINPPEAGILSVSSIRKTPVVIEEGGEETIQIRSVMNVTLSVDHRIIDGLTAVRFLNQVKALVEKPISIIV